MIASNFEFPTGRLVPFRFSRGWCASVPPSGEGERPASASRRGSRTEPAPCVACLVAAAVPPSAFPPPTPVRVPSYRVPARRFKDSGGVAFPSPGSGGRRGPQGAVAAAPSDSRSRGGRLPFPRHAAVAGVWEPPLGARGARLRVPGSPVRRRSRAPCLSVPTRFLVSCSRLSRWPARGEPLSGPPPPLRGRRVERGPCRRQHFFFRKEKNVRTTLSGGSLGSCVDEERS